MNHSFSSNVIVFSFVGICHKVASKSQRFQKMIFPLQVSKICYTFAARNIKADR